MIYRGEKLKEKSFVISFYIHKLNFVMLGINEKKM